jgi:hypothetical protein
MSATVVANNPAPKVLLPPNGNGGEIFYPEYDYLPEPIVAYRLNKDGEFIKAKVKKGRICSQELNLELVDTGESLRLFNPNTKSFLPNLSELAEQAQEAEYLAAEKARKAERLAAENERLKAEIARLTGKI